SRCEFDGLELGYFVRRDLIHADKKRAGWLIDELHLERQVPERNVSRSGDDELRATSALRGWLLLLASEPYAQYHWHHGHRNDNYDQRHTGWRADHHVPGGDGDGGQEGQWHFAGFRFHPRRHSGTAYVGSARRHHDLHREPWRREWVGR